jgi:chemotaxis protein methyltransferase CheR
MLEKTQGAGVYDLILCRNMLMYLCNDNRKQVLENLANSIVRDGIMMLGAAETVIGQTERFQASREFRGFYELAAKQNG